MPPDSFSLYLHANRTRKNMLKKIDKPSVIEAAGNKPKIIEEYIGRVNSRTDELSIARMKSPSGWIEPGQKPEFNEYTVVLKGMLRVMTKEETIDIYEGEAVIIPAGEWVRYSTPSSEGAEYIAVCLPAFSPEIVHRDE
jgi:mannose-6-phosphate isomerase-like protein (cupin superfamily)